MLWRKRLPASKPNRWILIRDVAVLQVKLIADGFRDLVLMPMSLIAGFLSLIQRDGPGPQFYDLLKAGRRSDRWINLFGAASRLHGPAGSDDGLPGQDIDQMVDQLESFIVKEYRSGGLTSQAKSRLDQALDVLRKGADQKPTESP